MPLFSEENYNTAGEMLRTVKKNYVNLRRGNVLFIA